MITKLISEEKIDERLTELATEINSEYKDSKALTVIGILNGSFIFCSDLVKKMNFDFDIQFMMLSSYEGGTESTGRMKVDLDLVRSIEGRDILIIEDIVDTGRTMVKLKELLALKNPNSIKICTLLSKPSRRVVDIDLDYIGFTIEDLFVVGYGMDLNYAKRNLPYIGICQ